MKNSNTKTFLRYSAAIIIAIFAVVIVVVPTLASADYYDYNRHGNYSYNPTTPLPGAVYLNYGTSNYRPQPVYYPQPVIQSVYYPQPVPQTVYYPTPSYPALYVSCSPNTYSTNTGNTVVWTATVSGGSGYYTYSWSGTDGLYGNGSSISKSYYQTGTKYASVTVSSGNQGVTQSCRNTVAVYDHVYQNPTPVYYPVPAYNSQAYTYSPTYQNAIYPNPTIVAVGNGLDIGCYVDPSNVSVNQPVTWNAEVTGGLAPYRYSWTGSDGLTGSQASAIKYYSTAGNKSAIISVTSADGKTGTRACSNSVTVKNVSSGTYVRPQTVAPAQLQVQPPVQQAPQTAQPENTRYSAAALFSLSNVPWGLVAILVILVLFATVLYLLFNRNKI